MPHHVLMTTDVATHPDDLDQLFGAALEAAAALLAANGEFYPFALALTATGELVTPSIDPGEDQPAAGVVVELLLAALQADVAGLRATALCTDVRLATEGTGGADAGTERDAIRVELEPRDADPITVVVPYSSGPVLDEPFGIPGQRRVFG